MAKLYSWQRVLAVIVASGAVACAAMRPEPALVAQVLSTHGGALESFQRESDLRVHYGFPGTWRWRIAYRKPRRFALTLITDHGDQEYVSDGDTVRGYADGALLVSEPLESSALASLVRWTAVTTLTGLDDGRLRVAEREPVDETAGGESGKSLALRWASAEASFVLTIGPDGSVRTAAGPIEIPPIGSGRLRAEFSDYRRVRGYLLPFRIAYFLNDQPLLDETVLEFIPDPQGFQD